MLIISNWTKNNSPAAGLSPIVRIINAATGVLIRQTSMAEYGAMNGSYFYDFIDYDPAITYLIRSDAGISTVDYRYQFASGQNEANIITQILNASMASISPADETLGGMIKFIAGIEGGKWEMKNNQMIFYDKDNVTEIARFNVFNISGTPSMQDVMKRERV